MAEAGKITVKLTLDTTEFYPALEDAKKALEALRDSLTSAAHVEVVNKGSIDASHRINAGRIL